MALTLNKTKVPFSFYHPVVGCDLVEIGCVPPVGPDPPFGKHGAKLDHSGSELKPHTTFCPSSSSSSFKVVCCRINYSVRASSPVTIGYIITEVKLRTGARTCYNLLRPHRPDSKRIIFLFNQVRRHLTGETWQRGLLSTKTKHTSYSNL